MTATQRSLFTGQMLFVCPTQTFKALKGHKVAVVNKKKKIFNYFMISNTLGWWLLYN